MRSIVKLLLSLLFALPSQAQTFTNVIVDNSAYDAECAVVMNPTDPLNIVAARNLDMLYRSFDGGLTWQDSSLAYPMTQNYYTGDIALTTDNNGRIIFQVLSNQYALKHFTSTDGGNNWTPATTVTSYGHKNCITTDRVNGSPYFGRTYTAWTEMVTSPQLDKIHLVYTDDGGATWSSRRTLTTATVSSTSVCGVGLACGPGGDVYTTWCGNSPNRIYFKKSVDGGFSWPFAQTIVDANVLPSAAYGAQINHPLSYSTQFTTLACDVSGGAYNGNLYCVWDDIRNGPENSDVFLARSTDNGQTWSTQRLNDDLGTRNQIIPNVVVDQSSGWVYVAYMDARTNTGTGSDDSLHYYLAFSSDGGQTFTNVQVSQQLSTAKHFHADYMGLCALNGNIGCLWGGGVHTYDTKLWYAPITQSQLVGIADQKSEKIPPLLLYPAVPNPAIDFTAFDFQLAETDDVTLTITDINGRKITTLLNKATYTNGRHQVRMQHSEFQLAAGVYVATITTGEHTASRKFTVYK